MSVSISEQARKDYDDAAASYDEYGQLPSGKLESELIQIALRNCIGCTNLDLGGGTGRHAREALELGAAAVDVVDISAVMLEVGRRQVEEALGRESRDDAPRVRFFEADVAKPLDHLPLRAEGYDVVMGNWIFSFADSLELLDGMFSNITHHLKAGGRFVGVRDADPWSPVLVRGKYGGSCSDLREIPGGVRYLCVLHSTPPVEFEGACLEVIHSGSTELYEKFGLGDVEIVPYESAPVVRRDPEFWEDFLDRPCFAVVQAVKRRDESASE